MQKLQISSQPQDVLVWPAESGLRAPIVPTALHWQLLFSSISEADKNQSKISTNQTRNRLFCLLDSLHTFETLIDRKKGQPYSY